ncbi:hypothetical protein PAAG_11520 [Paracoccidioides lutzii Pb01]|uniref:PPM-type phosphatase domain-containing protein n=1 Tax=Paracoccidioides lutzii (strain ATCC MYA-826 / Pb01) TaxID=502779 RepID=A0A0A2V6R0_PARBA|nr:hypothetical protein PAAG_11520 [Paracoccidioides lutzii Pb01]KGQ01795.1 hypothetical protein PAAG_11520 [Paracoccidioides lutzii Pb01]
MFSGSTSPTKEKDNTAPASGPGPTVLSINTEDTVPVLENNTNSPSGHVADISAAAARTGAHHLRSATSDETPVQKLGRMDPALIVPQGSLNNSAGESAPTAHSSFRVGVTEDKNRKCRRTMEDTHAYLYNFLGTSAPTPAKTESPAHSKASEESISTTNDSSDSMPMIETDNGYFAIFDGHAGTFAAEWCGKKLHLILEDIMRKHPNSPVPELLDQTFTNVDQQLEKLPLKNSGCTAVTAILRWEDRTTVPTHNPTAPSAGQSKPGADKGNTAVLPVQTSRDASGLSTSAPESTNPKPQETITSRHRVLYTANVGDARVVLCRNGKALRLSYDHKGSDENEGKRISNAGGLILNNRVNGVLAVTRALGDSYMKDLVTGHPYTTETVIQPETDEFMILACDGLWDVCSDQEAVDLVRGTEDPQVASKILVDHALSRFSTDNLSCMIVRFDTKAIQLAINQRTPPSAADNNLSTFGIPNSNNNDLSAKFLGGMSEADKIVEETRRKVRAGKLGGEVSADDDDDENAMPIENLSAVENEDLGPEVSPAELKGVIEGTNLDLGVKRSKVDKDKNGVACFATFSDAHHENQDWKRQMNTVHLCPFTGFKHDTKK